VTKFERCVALLYLLRRNPQGLRAREIAAELGTTERTVYRDIASLNEAFDGWLRIVFIDGGYRIDSRAYLPPLVLTSEELDALRSAADSTPPASPHAQRLRQAVAKVISICAGRAGQPQSDGQFCVISPVVRDRVSWRRLYLLEEAIRHRWELRVQYYSLSSRAIGSHILHPYALTFRKHAWYLVGRCETHQEMHLLRASRIRSARRTGGSFVRPADFSVDRFFAQRWQVFGGEPVTVRIRFSADVAPLIEELEWHPTQNLEAEAGGGLVFTAQIPLSPELTAWVLSWGGECEVLEPQELREEVAGQGLKIAQVYGAGSDQNCQG